METTRQTSDPIVASLREHVLSPLAAAERAVEREYEEVRAERQAFVAFKERIAGIETVSATRDSPAPTPRTYTAEDSSRTVERLRNAFRETVTSVDHYEETYGETLDEHAAAELSADVATVFQRDRTAFTELQKRALTSAVESAVSQRGAFLETLDDERRSLRAGREGLLELVDDRDGVVVPDGYRANVEERLDEIAATRQATVQNRDALSRTKGHDLCEYLYRECDWTYPVLTAVTRFRTAVL